MAKKKSMIELIPKKDCPDCYGRGWLSFIHHYPLYRTIRPCHCIKALVKTTSLEDKWREELNLKLNMKMRFKFLSSIFSRLIKIESEVKGEV